MKKNQILGFVLLLFFVGITNAQIVDNAIDDPGDLVIVAYENSNSSFSFVFLDNCPDGTNIRFTDEEWVENDDATFNFKTLSAEGDVLWINNTGETILQGTVINIGNADNNAEISTNIGVATEDNLGFNLAQMDDEIIAITGTRGSPGTFLAILGDSHTGGTTLEGTSLVNGVNALLDTSVTTGRYTGSASCAGLLIQQCAEQLNNISNWTFGAYTYPDDVISSLELSSSLSSTSTPIEEFQYYPNPVKNILKITTVSLPRDIIIYNVLGEKQAFKIKKGVDIEINTSKFRRGTYYMAMIFEDNTRVVSFVKE